ncbi:hypothetical protein VIGAN_01096200 [Vigna angularis var. angularis]|uniref:Uncharacterized protein n=1 Tax=Vigna angularis var. angularis TaxID=157739 RepID=A0A0S3QYR1_PHAAN|nr:hypothetical protein VIGAN_01096200 [Vigna angularis var. angularis]
MQEGRVELPGCRNSKKKLVSGRNWETQFDLAVQKKVYLLTCLLSFSEVDNLMLSSRNNLNSSSNNGITSSDMPPLPQCLPLDSITECNRKYTRELRRVLGVSVGNTSKENMPNKARENRVP